ncbi:heme ABC transporter ATP-binding protein [Micromonospora aurantiaca (nom. illeg.)]|uniref:heme ABC transporter ATP-binding protein n=1 Tax=Micromonospora aurantiaca (nom. illeg.) TaxID=47850 RepID=UPI00365C1581
MSLPRTPRRFAAARPPRPAPAGHLRIRVAGLRVERAGRTVLDGIDLQVRAGEVHALVGPNGAGKSTLLGAISGDVPAAAGRIEVDGLPRESWSPVELAWRRAVLTQRNTLSFPFTVGEVVRMGRAPWAGRPEREQDDAVVADVLERCDVARFAARPYPALSGGEQARAALARVLAQRATTLLLDEPTAALDLRHQELVMRIARERARAGDAVVVVLHDLTLTGAYADTVTLLGDGRVRAAGTPREVLTAPLLSEVYRYDIDVVPHPRDELPLIVPRRGRPAGPSADEERQQMDTQTFAARLRAETRDAHRSAESQRYVSALTAGELDVAGYTALVVAHHGIYAALEGVADTMRDDPLAGPFVDDALTRLPALAADLRFLLGPRWREVMEPVPAAVAYAARITSACAGSPERFIAHHYNRYLGDLSGGRHIGRCVARYYGVTEEAGASFYTFPGISDPKSYKDAYRARLDALALDEAGRSALRDEVLVAYEHNIAVFTDLGRLVAASGRQGAA